MLTLTIIAWVLCCSIVIPVGQEGFDFAMKIAFCFISHLITEISLFWQNNMSMIFVDSYLNKKISCSFIHISVIISDTISRRFVIFVLLKYIWGLSCLYDKQIIRKTQINLFWKLGESIWIFCIFCHAWNHVYRAKSMTF